MLRPRILLATFAAFLLLILFGFGTPAAARPTTASGSVADMQITPTTIRWQVHLPNAGLVLTVSAPDGQTTRQEFGSGVPPTLSNVDLNGQPRAGGTYMYELRVVPQIDDATRTALRNASEGDRAAVAEQLQRSGALPPEQVQSGSFMIANGAFVLPASEPAPTTTVARPAQNNQSITGTSPQAAPQDIVQADDLIVQGSACVGLDCVNNENFGFDTLRLKENNTRIGFDDTSATAGFPANDWQLTANDSASGGANKFSIDDVTGGKTPFTVIAGAPTDSLYISNIGRIGLGTSTPGLNMHINTGNTPAIRFEQNNGVGFAAQTLGCCWQRSKLLRTRLDQWFPFAVPHPARRADQQHRHCREWQRRYRHRLAAGKAACQRQCADRRPHCRTFGCECQTRLRGGGRRASIRPTARHASLDVELPHRCGGCAAHGADGARLLCRVWPRRRQPAHRRARRQRRDAGRRQGARPPASGARRADHNAQTAECRS